ncbi:UNVERIFIED_CONTAM: hypothetical protein Scaly_1157900 [Sesamum calycinum]|uniref:MULE transposase domain-containing protein n=1 Tax=Sesamum calycinum TaxID=2727403 RepID=A0AAW2Q2X8_9LAMI
MSLRDPSLNGNPPPHYRSDTEDEEGGNTECDDGVEGSGREDEGDNLEESSGEGEGELSNFEDFNSDKDSDEEDGPKYPVFSDTETFDPKFDIGMLFSSKKELRIAIHSHAAYRAKWNALKKIEGLSVDQYGMLWDYVEELRRSNPGSTFILSRAASDGSGGSKFGKLYGPHGGVMLTAVGIDPNNDSFPIAYAVVGGETRETWEWFLTLLRNDLNIHRDSDYTFMSDKQKGLIPAFETVFPTAENRFCVRHLHANMKRWGSRGYLIRKLYGKAARATTVTEFEARRKKFAS